MSRHRHPNTHTEPPVWYLSLQNNCHKAHFTCHFFGAVFYVNRFCVLCRHPLFNMHCLMICRYQYLLTIIFHPLRSPPEKTWSYKCVNHRCVRQHYLNKDEKRTTFLTCSMLCGSQTLWPEPTVKSLIGTNANSFKLTDVKYKVQTPFRVVESLMGSAFSIFLEEIKQMMHASGGKATDDAATRATTNRNVEDFDINHDTPVSSPRRRLAFVNIYVNVIKTADVHLTLSTDECYNMTMSSEEEARESSPQGTQ